MRTCADMTLIEDADRETEGERGRKGDRESAEDGDTEKDNKPRALLRLPSCFLDSAGLAFHISLRKPDSVLTRAVRALVLSCRAIAARSRNLKNPEVP